MGTKTDGSIVGRTMKADGKGERQGTARGAVRNCEEDEGTTPTSSFM